MIPRWHKLAIALICFALAGLCLSGCSDSSPIGHGHFEGWVYAAPLFKSPVTADAELSRIGDSGLYVNKFRTGIHPESGLGAVISFTLCRPDVSQLFDGSNWETDWDWYRRLVSIALYFDEHNLPSTVSNDLMILTVHEWTTDDIGTRIYVSLTW